MWNLSKPTYSQHPHFLYKIEKLAPAMVYHSNTHQVNWEEVEIASYFTLTLHLSSTIKWSSFRFCGPFILWFSIHKMLAFLWCQDFPPHINAEYHIDWIMKTFKELSKKCNRKYSIIHYFILKHYLYFQVSSKET